ncbi:MAG: hypothetical protein SangKO_086950 [Sandaracinaceae bacterium]
MRTKDDEQCGRVGRFNAYAFYAYDEDDAQCGRWPEWLFGAIALPKDDPRRLMLLDAVVWVLLSTYDGARAPTHPRLAERLGVTERSLRRSIRRLARLHLVEVRKVEGGRAYAMLRPAEAIG